MADCCNNTTGFDGQSPAYRRTLWIVIGINAIMFAVEMITGALSGSQALQADALDFAGDTATYALSLWVIGKPLLWRSRAATFKGLSLLVMGATVLIMTLQASMRPEPPVALWMGSVAVLALVANVVSALLLMRFRDGDANVRSVWLCSRNDAIGNLGVLVAAVLVAWLDSPWPDLIFALIMASLFTHSAVSILRQARQEASQPTDSTH
ncbi:MAG: cation transporter [Alcanivoracaceae bacterium]|jgi:Co/Zn/Cd efflux system component